MAPPAIRETFSPEAFRGRVYGVTGAAHGIGEAAASRLLRLGARVVVIDVDPDEVDRVRESWRPHGKAVRLVRGDVADDRVLRRAVRLAHGAWGRVDGWVSNAGFNPGGRVEEVEPERFDQAWAVNVRAAWTAARLVLPLLPESGGSLVHVGSILAWMSYPLSTAYAATKAGLEGLTRAMAVEFAPRRVRVNAVVPGMIDTFGGFSTKRVRRFRGGWSPDVPPEAIERWRDLRNRFRRHQWQLLQPWPIGGQPDDVAGAILFLLSDASGFMTGTSLLVDGAMAVHHPHVMSLDVAAAAADRAAMIELGERHPALRMRNILPYSTPDPRPARSGSGSRKKPRRPRR